MNSPATAPTTENASEKTSLLRRTVIWFFITMRVIGAFLAVDAIMSARTAQGSIAWSIGLIAAPTITVPAYLIFGRDKFSGYLEARRENQAEFDALVASVEASMEQALVRFETRTPAFDAVRELTHTRLTKGNRVELLVNGEETFNSIIEGIGEATDYVLVQFYIIHDDGLGRRLQEALIERARAGVMVVLLLDELGSTSLPDSYIDELRDAGAKVSNFNTTQGVRNKFQVNFRNHRKIVVVDGKSAWIGGHNVGDEYLGLDKNYSPWRDTHVRVDGPVAIQAQGVIVSDWYWAQRELLDLKWEPRPVEGSDVMAMVIPTGPADPHETAGMFFVHTLNVSTERIWITAPYFIPDSAITKALMLASLRGVDVRVMLPGISDNLAAQLAGYYFVDLMKDTNVHFCSYQDGFLHQKVALIDDHSSVIGSHNFDNRSFRLNFEVGVLIHDRSFNSEVEAMLLDDFDKCTAITPADLSEKSWLWHFGVQLSRLLAPIL